MKVNPTRKVNWRVSLCWAASIEELQRAVRELRGPKWHWINLGAEKIGIL